MPAPAPKTVLLTLGRLPVALDIARACHALGDRVLVAEPGRMHMARMSRSVDRCFRVTSPVDDAAAYRAELLDILSGEGVDIIVPVSEEFAYVAALHDAVPAGTAVFGMPQDAVLDLHDKYRFAERARALGLRVPLTLRGDQPTAAEFAANNDFVCKPRFSSSGRRVEIGAAGDALTLSADRIVQERIRGDEFSGFTIAREGRCVARVIYRATVVDGSVAVAFERIDDPSDMTGWMETFLRATNFTGFAAFDFIVGDDGAAVALECNPRATSGIHFLTPDAITRAIFGREPPVLGLRPESRLTESYSCFTVTLRSLFGRQAAARNWRELRSSRDVTWSRQDPWPFLLMMVNTAPLIVRAVATRQSFAAAAVADIEWRLGDADAR